MYRPKTYIRVMEFATALRTVGARRLSRRAYLFVRILHLFDSLVERAYEVGHDEGYREGWDDGRRESKEEAGCHHAKDEEWEARVSP